MEGPLHGVWRYLGMEAVVSVDTAGRSETVATFCPASAKCNAPMIATEKASAASVAPIFVRIMPCSFFCDLCIALRHWHPD